MNEKNALARLREHGRAELAKLRETPLERQVRENREKRRRQENDRLARNEEILARTKKDGAA